MCRRLFYLISVLVLSLACTSQAIVIGDFENGSLDGWSPAWEGDPSLTVGTTGVTSGNSSLDVVSNGGYWIIQWGPPTRTALDLSNVTTLEMDLTMLADDFTEDVWTQVDKLAINSDLGWREVQRTAVIDRDTGEAAASNDWGRWSGDSNRTIVWDIAGAGYDWTGLLDSSFVQIVISLQGAATFHIDNIRLNGAELIEIPPLAKIIYVTSDKDQDVDGVQDNLSWIEWLEAEGYEVDFRPENWVDPLDVNEIAELEAADLIIASRGMSTGSYDGDEAAKWNAISTPIICTNAWMIRSNRWVWMDSTSANKDAGAPAMQVLNPAHPIFAGVETDANGIVEILDPNVASGHTSFLTDILDVGNGTLLAKAVPGVYDTTWIVEWPAGVEYYEGAGQVTGGPRILFMAGTQDDPYLAPDGVNISPVDVLNLNDTGRQMFLNAIKYLLGAPRIVWVTENIDRDEDGVQDDQGWIDLLVGEGYLVDTRKDYWMELDPNKVEELNAADLVIISRTANSGNYDDGDEIALWNSVESPLIQLGAWLVRSSRWLWVDSGDVQRSLISTMEVLDPGHPIFAGVELDENNQVEAVIPDFYDVDTTGYRGTCFINSVDMGNGTLLAQTAQTADVNSMGWIAEWAAGVEFYDGAGAIAGGKRLMFNAGTQDEAGAVPQGALNLNDAGIMMFLNAVEYMLPVEPVHSWTFEDGTADDSADDADGVLIGNAAVRAGALDLTDGGYMSMPGDVIAMNTYDEVTVEIWFTSVPGGNTGFHMITAFGEEGTGAADWAGYKYLFVTPARGDDVSRVAIQTRSMDDSPWDEETGVSAAIEHDDGLQHYFVCTVDATDITFYIDGELVGSAALDPNNAISGIGTDVAYIGKGVYPVDPCWVGTVEELNIYDRVLCPGQVQANYAAGPLKLGPEPVDPGTDGLLAYYPLDAVYRGTTPDASGNGNDGTVLGDPAFVEGMVAQAIDLDGDGDYVDCGANPLFGMQETNEMTAACWVTIRSIANQWAAIVAKGEHAWRLGNASLDPRFHFGITIWNAPDTASTDGVLAVGFDEWHHVAGVFDGANIILYVDGALDISVPTTEPIGTNELNVFIGDNPEATGRYWDGLVDELMIYNRALSENEVLFLAQ